MAAAGLDRATLTALGQCFRRLNDREATVSELRSEIPRWHGGTMACEEVMRRANTLLVRSADGTASAASAADLAALLECLRGLESGEGAERRRGASRRTIVAAATSSGGSSTAPVVRCGEELRVLHVCEVLPPLASPADAQLYCMGPKAVLGEYVNGDLVGRRGDGPAAAELRAEAREAFAVADAAGTGALGLDGFVAAMRTVGLDALLQGADGRPAAAADVLRVAGSERIDASAFERLAAHVLGAGEYDGAVEPGPGVDVNWEVTRHTFGTPGEHTISWHGLEHFAGLAPSNVLTVTVLPPDDAAQPPTPPTLSVGGAAGVGGPGGSGAAALAAAALTSVPRVNIDGLDGSSIPGGAHAAR
jgi:hypothetical protein